MSTCRTVRGRGVDPCVMAASATAYPPHVRAEVRSSEILHRHPFRTGAKTLTRAVASHERKAYCPSLKHPQKAGRSQWHASTPSYAGARKSTTKGLESTTGAGPAAPAVDPDKAKVDVADLSPREASNLARDADVAVLAPVMPTTLIRPLEAPAPGAAAGPAWGITAVGAGRVAVRRDRRDRLDPRHGHRRPARRVPGRDAHRAGLLGQRNGDRQAARHPLRGHRVRPRRLRHAHRRGARRPEGAHREGPGRRRQRQLRRAVPGHETGRCRAAPASSRCRWASTSRAWWRTWSARAGRPTSPRRWRSRPTGANLRMFDEIMRMAEARVPFDGGAVVVAAAGNREPAQRQRRLRDRGLHSRRGRRAWCRWRRSSRARTAWASPPSRTRARRSAVPGWRSRRRGREAGWSRSAGPSMATPHVAGVTALWWQAIKSRGIPATARNVVAQLLANAKTEHAGARHRHPRSGGGHRHGSVAAERPIPPPRAARRPRVRAEVRSVEAGPSESCFTRSPTTAFASPKQHVVRSAK